MGGPCQSGPWLVHFTISKLLVGESGPLLEGASRVPCEAARDAMLAHNERVLPKTRLGRRFRRHTYATLSAR